jgi:apyrase
MHRVGLSRRSPSHRHGQGTSTAASSHEPPVATAAVCAGYIRKMSAGGKTYHVYVHSYLGYGLMQGRGAILRMHAGSSCLPAGVSGVYKSGYGGGEVQLVAGAGGGDAGACRKVVTGALKVGSACGAVVDECSFAGAWGGATSQAGRRFFVMSYFFDRCALAPCSAPCLSVFT